MNEELTKFKEWMNKRGIVFATYLEGRMIPVEIGKTLESTFEAYETEIKKEITGP